MASRSAESSCSAGELAGNGGRESYSLRHLHTNKLSHKISKPLIRKPAVAGNDEPLVANLNTAAVADDQNPPPQQPPQPPVYNISKNDFRDVVQRLTGAPPHDPPAQPPAAAVQPPRPPASSSRLHRIRPPPLAQLTARPPPMNHFAVDPAIPAAGAYSSINPNGRQGLPMSPLPPLPGVHVAAESPVSAYMRRLRNSSADSRPNQPSCLSPLAHPRWPAEQGTLPPGAATATTPLSPSPYPLIPPGAATATTPLSPSPYRLIPPVPLFPPTSPSQLMGFQFPQMPLSPSVPSPKP